MNKRILNILLALLLTSLAVVSCRDKDEKERDKITVKSEITITLDPGKWVYYRMKDSTIVGKSDIGDALQDEEWRGRMDWDIALSESSIRSNSGASGKGKGGIATLTDSLYDVSDEYSLMSLKYQVDTLGVTLSRPLNK